VVGKKNVINLLLHKSCSENPLYTIEFVLISGDLYRVRIFPKKGLFPKGVLTMSTSIKPLDKIELVFMSRDLYKLGLFPTREALYTTSLYNRIRSHEQRPQWSRASHQNRALSQRSLDNVYFCKTSL